MRLTRTSLLIDHRAGSRVSPRALSHTHESMLVMAALLLPLLVSFSTPFFPAGRSPADAAPTLVTNDMSRVEIKPMVDDSAWRRMQVMPTPEIVGQVTVPHYQYNTHDTLPVLQVKGADIDHRLPPALWVKLEQPGQAFLYIDSNAGLFVKPLDEATPGFVSRCNLGRDGYASAEGDFVQLDTANLVINSLWIVQDASTEGMHAPGFVALGHEDYNELPPYIADK